MSCLSEIGLSRKQRVFVTLESTCGTLQFPNATTDGIIPAGDAVINQTPTFVDSDEKKNSLDIIDRFQNAMPAGEWSIPMYLRLPDKSFATPQGDALFKAWQGELVTSTAASNSADWATSTPALIHIEGIIDLDGFPGVGVVEVASAGTTQQVHYGVLHQAENSATASLGDLTMGYNGTTAATANDDAASPTSVTLVSRFFNQTMNSPSLSIWIETDHFVQGLAGATVNNVVLGVNNEGAVTLEFSGQGMEMVWAGTSTIATPGVAAGSTHATVSNPKYFSVGAKIYNSEATSGATGHTITAISATTGVIDFDPAVPATGTWASGDTIRGFLPVGTTIGTPIESRLTDIEIDNVAAKLKSADLTFGVPKLYVEDEIGLDYPEDYIEDIRDITSTLSVYFKKANAKYFTDGYDGNEVPLLFKFGSAQGDIMEIYMKRCSLEVPTIGFTAPSVELSIPMKALGTYGEDSCDVVLT